MGFAACLPPSIARGITVLSVPYRDGIMGKLIGNLSLMTYRHANYRTLGLSTEGEDGDCAMNDIVRLFC